MLFISSLNRVNPYLIIAVLYSIVSLMLYQMYGCKVVNDTHRFLEYAEGLKSGFYIDPHNIWYIGYVLFLLIFQSVGCSLESIVLIQYLLSFISVLALYYTSFLLFNHRAKALLATIGYIFFVEILTWNSYLIAESLYLSLTCISLMALARLVKNRLRWSDYVLGLIIVVMTFFTKPTGIALVAAIAAFITYKVYNGLSQKWARLALGVTATLVILFLANRMLATFRVIENYQKGEIIYGISELPIRPEYAPLLVTPPGQELSLHSNLPPIVEIVHFVGAHPAYWLELFFKKVAYLLLHIRPYWSAIHNVYALCYLVPLYFLVIKGFSGGVMKKEVTWFFATYLMIHILTVGITVVDWDGRFLMPLLPVLFIIASGSSFKRFERINK